jgi:hypothetical protein
VESKPAGLRPVVQLETKSETCISLKKRKGHLQVFGPEAPKRLASRVHSGLRHQAATLRGIAETKNCDGWDGVGRCCSVWEFRGLQRCWLAGGHPRFFESQLSSDFGACRQCATQKVTLFETGHVDPSRWLKRH